MRVYFNIISQNIIQKQSNGRLATTEESCIFNVPEAAFLGSAKLDQLTLYLDSFHQTPLCGKNISPRISNSDGLP